jgi:hypothetical protein
MMRKAELPKVTALRSHTRQVGFFNMLIKKGGAMVAKRRSLFLGVVLSLKLTVAVLFMLFIAAGLAGTSLFADEAAGKKEVKEQKNPYADAEITIKIIPAANNTFGYDILLYGRPLIHQPNIPGLPGNEGFTTKERAQTVAEFVVKKIRNNEMPPTVTIEDLNTMGVLK